MKLVVTGAAGFIGSNLVDALLKEGHFVIGVDNFSTGRREFIGQALQNPRFQLFERDLVDPDSLNDILNPEVMWVFHLAANADVRFGLDAPTRDLKQNVMVTSNVLEAMRKRGVSRIVFSSTGSVYGEATQIPTPENGAFPVQTSFYGASKLSAEALIAAYCEGFQFEATVFRFVSILGERYTHGHVIDFVTSLKKDSSQIKVLGNGKQRKSYLCVTDCVGAMLLMSLEKRKPDNPEPGPRFQEYNLGTDESVTVDESLDIICEEMKLSPKRIYSGGDRGWVGDNPIIFLDCNRIRKRGWSPKFTIQESVRMTVRYLLERNAI